MKFIATIVAALLPTASVDTLVSVLAGFITKLQAAERQQNDAALKLEVQAQNLTYRARDARERAAKAGRLASNLNTMLD